MAFKGEGAGMLFIQNKEVETSIAVKIVATLHIALSILKFGKDLPHLSKQCYVITVSDAPSTSSATCYFALATAIPKSVFKCSGIIHPVLGHAAVTNASRMDFAKNDAFAKAYQPWSSFSDWNALFSNVRFFRRLSAYWKAFFVSLGGPYGSCGTALYLMLLLLPARRSLMI
nr:hypothetical protein [Tanacetum cinerariifolium]